MATDNDDINSAKRTTKGYSHGETSAPKVNEMSYQLVLKPQKGKILTTETRSIDNGQNVNLAYFRGIKKNIMMMYARLLNFSIFSPNIKTVNSTCCT